MADPTARDPVTWLDEDGTRFVRVCGIVTLAAGGLLAVWPAMVGLLSLVQGGSGVPGGNLLLGVPLLFAGGGLYALGHQVEVLRKRLPDADEG